MRLKLRVMMVCVPSACGLWGLSWVTAGAASARVNLSATVQPNTLRYPQERVLTYRLAMTTGDREERLVVAPGSPPFARSAPVTLEGPGVLTPTYHADPGTSDACPRLPGGRGSMQFYEITLPPLSTSVLVTKATLFTAPFPRADLSVYYSVNSDDTSSSQRIADLSLRSPRPTLTGQRGVPITLTTRPQKTPRPTDGGRLVQIRLGSSVLVRGRTDPAVGGDRIALRAARAARFPGRRRPVTIARVRVAGDGRFSARWRPRRRGFYYLYAVYRSPRASLSNASTLCEIPVEVR